MKRDFEETLQSIEKLVQLINQSDKVRRTYGTEHALTRTEIHIMDEIGRCEGIGVKGIAQNKGVTEGAISQIIKKLATKGLIRKEVSRESEAKVCLFLTNEGQICYLNHQKYHKQANQKWQKLFNDLTEQEYQCAQSLLEQAINMLQETREKES